MKKLFTFLVLSMMLAACSSDKNPQPDRLSYYSPGHGTQNAWYGVPKGQPQLKSYAQASGDIVAFMAMGRYVSRINNGGEVQWLTPLSGGYIIRVSSVESDHIKFMHAGHLKKVNIETGEVSLVKKFGTTMDYVEGAFNLEYGEASSLTTPDGFVVGPFKYPRGADRIGNRIVVADTWGHKTDIFEGETLIVSVEGYYPGQALFIDSDTVLITEEHANKVYKYTISSGVKEAVFNCKAHDIYTDLWATVAEFSATELSGMLNVPNAIPDGICAREHQGEKTLYSPGGARPTVNGFIISDSDNHRVVEIDSSGNVLREVLNLNQPIDAVVLN